MRRTRRYISIGAGVTAVGLVLAACGASSTASAPSHSTTTAPSRSTTIKLYNDKGAEDTDFAAIGKQSQTAIGVKEVPVGYTNEDTYTALIDASFRTSQKPNVFTWHTGSSLAQVAQQHDLASTSSIWKQAIADGDLPKGLESYYTVGNQQYCVPLYVSDYVMFYNKQIFAKDHLVPPTTWTQLLADAQTIKSGGVTPFYQTDVLFSFIWFEQLLIGENPNLYLKLESGKASYTSPGVVSVMKQWKSLIDKGYMSNPAVTTAPQSLLKSGNVAMIPFGTWFTGDLNLVGANSSDYGMFVIPPENTALAKIPMNFETGPLCVEAHAPKMAADMKFLKWWTTPAPETEWSKLTSDSGADPKSISTDPQVVAIAKEAASSKVELIQRYYEDTPASILNTALSEFGAFMVKPNSYMRVLQTIQATAKEYWASNGG